MTIRTTTVACMAAGLALSASAAIGQTTQAPAKDETGKLVTTPIGAPRTKPVRKSVIDLEKMAKDRRTGQVMPGDPTPAAQPMGTRNIDAAPLNPPSNGTIQLPDTSPASRPNLKPTTEAPTAPTPEAMTPAPSPAPSTPWGSWEKSSPEAARGTMSATNLPEVGAPASSAAMPAPEAPSAMTTNAGSPRPSTAPMAEVVHPTPSPEREPARFHAEALPHIEAAPVRNEPTPGPTLGSGSQPDTMVGGVGIVDRNIVTTVPMAMSTGSAKVRVQSLSGETGGVQWRAGSDAWKAPGVDDVTDSRIEVRAGLDSEAVLVVDDRVQIRITRLGRAIIERTEEPGGMTGTSITLSRGAAEIRPLGTTGAVAGEMFARVKTPDQVFGLTGPLRVEYDAFTGTRRRTLTP